MFARQTVDSPWPAETPLPAVSSSSSRPSRRRRRAAERHAGPAAIAERATIANQPQIDQAKAECFDADFSILSCWPTEKSSLPQNEGTQFVWNSRHPLFTQFNRVDIALKRADTGETILQFLDQLNPSNRAGSLPVIANDTWWGSSGASWPGTNVSFPLCFIIVPSGAGFDDLPPQSTFTAVQTTFANSVLASMSSSSSSSAAAAAASSSSVLASLSSQSAATTTSSGTDSGTITTINGVPTTIVGGHGGGSGLQDGSNSSSSFPHWAIAVIVILGFFALAALIALLFLIFQRIRRRNDVSRRGSMGSQSPMMVNVARNDTGYPTSPTIGAPPGSSGVAAGVGAPLLGGGSQFGGDGASAHSDAIISGADAAVMAEAFRKALRKPDFAGHPVEEGESPDAEGHHEVLSRELAEEGRDIRSVGSTRTPRVETMSDAGDTATARDSLV